MGLNLPAEATEAAETTLLTEAEATLLTELTSSSSQSVYKKKSWPSYLLAELFLV